MTSGRHVSEKTLGGRLIIIGAFVAAALVALYLIFSMFFVFAGGSFISRGAKEIDLSNSRVRKVSSLLRLREPESIDLRGNAIDASQYKSLAAAFPQCEIFWDVPLGGVGESWDNLSESVAVPVFSAEAAELYTLMPKLKEVDLRQAIVKPEDYELLRSLIPQCKIIWGIPIAGERYDSNALSLTIGDISAEDVKLFGYFTSLQSLTFDGTTHENYMAAEKHLQGTAVTRHVMLGQTPAYAGESYIDLSESSVTAQELLDNLVHLPDLRNVKLNSSAFGIDELVSLMETYPNIDFELDIYIGAQRFSCLDTAITVDAGVKAKELAGALGGFVALETIDLSACDYSWSELVTIHKAYPEAFIKANVVLYEQSFPTDAKEIDLSGVEIADITAIESSLPLFPKLEKVIMSDCGVPSEDMDALNRRHEDISFVWTIHFSKYSLRTDTKAFCASNVPGYVAPKLYDKDLVELKYLTELEALDLGHMLYTDLSFLEYMPNLRYLILVEANYRDISAISQLENLYYLEIFNNRIEDLSPLLECKNLRHLNVGYTRGYDATVLKGMTWLERLWFPGHGLEDDVAEEIAAALPNTQCYHPKWDAAGSTGGGWREHDSYFEMRDLFDMHYMPGGTGTAKR